MFYIAHKSVFLDSCWSRAYYLSFTPQAQLSVVFLKNYTTPLVLFVLVLFIDLVYDF